MSLSSIFPRRPDPSDASSAFAPPPAPAAGASLGDVALALGGVADPRMTRWAGYGLTLASVVLAIYEMLRPSIMATAFLLCLPAAVLALVIGSPTSFEVRSWRNGGRRIINGALAFPFMALIFPNIFRSQLDPSLPLVPAGLAAVVIMPLAWMARSRPGVAAPWTMFLSLVAAAATYGYGATAMSNIQFDTSAGTIIQTQLLGKHAHRGRSNSYYLDLPPWGPRTTPNSIEVSSSTYEALNTGDAVCITLHPGALNLAWFTAAACAEPPPVSN